MLDTITVRQMPFEFPEDIDPVIIEGDHKQSFALIAGSLLLPVASGRVPVSLGHVKKWANYINSALLDAEDRLWLHHFP